MPYAYDGNSRQPVGYLEKPIRMPLYPTPATGPKTVQVMKSEEKGSDVNLATYLLVDAFDKEYGLFSKACG